MTSYYSFSEVFLILSAPWLEIFTIISAQKDWNFLYLERQADEVGLIQRISWLHRHSWIQLLTHLPWSHCVPVIIIRVLHCSQILYPNQGWNLSTFGACVQKDWSFVCFGQAVFLMDVCTRCPRKPLPRSLPVLEWLDRKCRLTSSWVLQHLFALLSALGDSRFHFLDPAGAGCQLDSSRETPRPPRWCFDIHVSRCSVTTSWVSLIARNSE